MIQAIKSNMQSVLSKFCETCEFETLFSIESNDSDFAKAFKQITSSTTEYPRLVKSGKLLETVNRYMKIQKYRHCLVEMVLFNSSIESSKYAEPELFHDAIVFSAFTCNEHNILMTFNITTGQFSLIEYDKADLTEHLANHFIADNAAN